MKKINTILFPTDFTKDAVRAYEYALEIAKRTGANLHLMHAIEEPYDFATRIEETIQNITDEATIKFEKRLETISDSDEYSALDVSYSIERGKPYTAILSVAEEINADLLIMGTKGASSLKRILYGNVTSDVMLDSDVPVLTVPTNSKKPYLDRFLFATDYRNKDMEALSAIVTLAEVFNGEVHILHVSKNKSLDEKIRFRGFKDLVAENFDYDNIMFHHLETERFSKGVSNFLNEYPVSLIVITRYKKKFLRTLIWANNTQELTYHTHVPMLVLTPESLGNSH